MPKIEFRTRNLLKKSKFRQCFPCEGTSTNLFSKKTFNKLLMTEKSYKQFLVESLSAYTVISEHILITTRALKENLASLAAHFEVSNSVLG